MYIFTSRESYLVTSLIARIFGLVEDDAGRQKRKITDGI
jgi:hypothetical protein